MKPEYEYSYDKTYIVNGIWGLYNGFTFGYN